MKVTLIGMGPGNPDLLTEEARRAVDLAQLLVGAPRLLAPYSGGKKPCEELILAEEICDFLSSRRQAVSDAAVLLSGDVGYYSGAKRLLPLLERAGIEARSIPGISSLQYLCARVGLPWEETYSASAHGRDCDPARLLRKYGKVFFLTGVKEGQTPGDLCQKLAEAGMGSAQAWVGSRLSYPDESVVMGRARDFAGRSFPPLSVLLAWGGEQPEEVWGYRSAGIPDEAFLRGKVPMTKQEVRAVALAKLGVAPGDVLWDVGAGTGSVSVELALLAREGRVFAVERDPEAAALIRENAKKFRLENFTLVEGEAPGALEDLPAPDGVFLGGTGGCVREILALALGKNPRVRAVAAAITLETLSQAAAALGELPFGGVEVTQVTAARSKAAGGYHLMMGQNPVFLLRGEGKGEEKP